MMRLKNIVSRKLMPLFMRSDQFDASLGEGLDEIVKDMDAGIDQKLRFWDNFDNMTEEQLDEAAEELKVHWYRYDVGVETKREIIKGAKDRTEEIERLLESEIASLYVPAEQNQKCIFKLKSTGQEFMVHQVDAPRDVVLKVVETVCGWPSHHKDGSVRKFFN